MKRFLIALVAAVVSTGAFAQGSVQKNAIAIGKGPGVSGLGGIPPVAAGQCLVSTGVNTPPAFGACSGAGGVVSSFGGATGAITLGSGLAMAGQQLNLSPANVAAVTLRGNPTGSAQAPVDFTLNSLAALASPSATNDYLLIWDSTAGLLKKVNPSALIGSGSGFLPLSGGTLTGTLSIAPASGSADLVLNKSGSAQNNSIYGRTANSTRWAMLLGNFDAESGSSAGSNFDLYRYSDAGSYLGSALNINRATGTITAPGMAILGPGGTGTGVSSLTLNGGSGIGGGGYIGLYRNTVPDWFLGSNGAILGNNSSDFLLYGSGGLGQAIGVSNTTGATSILSTVASNSPSTGALTVAGGAGVGGALNVGGGITTSTDASAIGLNVGRYSGAYSYSVINAAGAGTGGLELQQLGVVAARFSSTSAGFFGTTPSNSPTTGALTVAGGLGVVGNINSFGNDSSIGPSGTAAFPNYLKLSGGSGSSGGSAIRYQKNGTDRWWTGNTSSILGGTDDNFLLYSSSVGSALSLNYTTGFATFGGGGSFTGALSAPTATVTTAIPFGTNTTQVASTAFVQAAVVGATAGVASLGGATGAITLNSDFSVPGNVLTGASTNGTGAFARGTSPTLTTPTISGAWVATSSQTIGDGTGQKTFRVNGGNSGISGGSFIAIANGGADYTALGNASAILGGAYDPTSTWYSGTGYHRITGLANCGSGISVTANGTLGCVPSAFASISNYSGFDCTGATSSSAAVASAYAASSTIVFPINCTIKLSTSQNWPKGKTYIIPCGTSINPDVSVVIDIRGTVQADHTCRIFAGAGLVSGIRRVRPEWWGALNNGTGNDAPALNLASQSTQAGAVNGSDGDVSEIKLSCGVYLVTEDVVFLPSKYNNLKVTGCGSVGAGGGSGIKGSGTGFTNGVVVIRGETVASALDDMDFTFKDFFVTHATNNVALSCMNIAPPGYKIMGYAMASLENIHIDACNTLLTIGSARQLSFTRMGLWTPNVSNVTGLYVNAQGAATGDAGDWDWWGGQITCYNGTAPTGGNGTGATFRSQVSGGNMAGIRFHGTVFYKCATAVKMDVGNGGKMGDFWFLNNQFEGNMGGILALDANATSGVATQVANIQFDGGYGTASCGTAFRIQGTVGDQIADVSIRNMRLRGNCSGPNNRFVTADNVRVMDIQNNKILDFVYHASMAELISLYNSYLITVQNNIAGVTAGTRTPYLVNTYGASALVTVTGNNAISGVSTATANNGSGGSNFITGLNNP